MLLLWSFLTKKDSRRKYLRLVSLAVFIVFTNPYLFNVLVRAWQTDVAALPMNKKYSAGILLGGLSKTDRHNNFYFASEADRFIQTTKLFRTGTISNIIVTGGNSSILKSNKLPEAIQLKNQLLLQGIPDSNIFIEHQSKNTFENARFTKNLLDTLHLAPPYILITSAMHVPRAKAVFNKAGLDVIPYAAAFKEIDSHKNLGDFIFPSVTVLDNWKDFLKEVIGLWVYKMSNKA